MEYDDGSPPVILIIVMIMDGLYSLDSIQSAVAVHPLFKEHDSTDIRERVRDVAKTIILSSTNLSQPVCPDEVTADSPRARIATKSCSIY